MQACGAGRVARLFMLRGFSFRAGLLCAVLLPAVGCQRLGHIACHVLTWPLQRSSSQTYQTPHINPTLRSRLQEWSEGRVWATRVGMQFDSLCSLLQAGPWARQRTCTKQGRARKVLQREHYLSTACAGGGSRTHTRREVCTPARTVLQSPPDEARALCSAAHETAMGRLSQPHRPQR